MKYTIVRECKNLRNAVVYDCCKVVKGDLIILLLYFLNCLFEKKGVWDTKTIYKIDIKKENLMQLQIYIIIFFLKAINSKHHQVSSILHFTRK